MFLDDELVLFILNEHAPTFVIDIHSDIHHSAAAQFALTHGERVRGGIQLIIMPISYVSNTNYGDFNMLFFIALEEGSKWRN